MTSLFVGVLVLRDYLKLGSSILTHYSNGCSNTDSRASKRPLEVIDTIYWHCIEAHEQVSFSHAGPLSGAVVLYAYHIDCRFSL